VTYDDKEKSEYGGRPVELYRFTWGTNLLTLTNADTDIVVGVETFATGWPLKRTEPELTQETQHSQLKIFTSMNMPIAALFHGKSPYDPIWVTVLRKHYDLAETSGVWQGKIRGVVFKTTKGDAEITCDPVDKAIGKAGFRQTCGPQCNKRLYGIRCGASEASFTVYGTVSAVDSTGYVVTVPGFNSKSNGYFTLGELYVQELSAMVQIVGHTGNDVTLKRPINGLEAGMSARGVAGCDHVWVKSNGNPGDCRAKFNNAINFLGWPFVPTKNPYEVGLEG
jgi:uncharacterized phage protein (TIGR02218 family)